MFNLTKFSRAISRVKWLIGEKTNVSSLNNLTRLIARENFIILSRRESNKSQCLISFASTEYECVPKSFRARRVERELQMVQLSATRCSCIAILRVSLVSFATITLCVAS
jgi:hypothetical protein